MGSSSKKHKDAGKRKRHRSRSESNERDYSPKEKRHRHRKHHKCERKREKTNRQEYESDGSDVIEITSSPREITPPPPQISSNNSPKASGHSTESLSINETNKLRAKLGLKPLDIKGDCGKDSGKKKDDYGEFYHKPATNIADRQRQEKLKAKLADRRDKRNFENKLARTKTLGESDSDDDLTSWIQKNRKLELEKRDADKRAKMLEELDAQFGVGEVVEQEERQKRRQKYTERNLKGLQVNHDMDSFQEGKTVILTLKDDDILAEKDDVLVNVNMIDDEKFKKNVENKKKKILYNAYDVEEIDKYGNLKKKSLLSQYDEEIEGEKRENFIIGIDDNPLIQRQNVTQSVRDKLNSKILETVETDRQIASDYYTENEMAKFKKPKKKTKKLREKGKMFTADDLENVAVNDKKAKKGHKREESMMIIDDTPDIPTFMDDCKLEENDDALERALNKARKLKQREQVANELINTVVGNLKSEESDEEVVDNTNSIVLNSTAEFCRTLGDIPTYGRAGNREEGEDLLDFEKELKKEDNVDGIDEDFDDNDDDIEILEGGRWNVVNLNEKKELKSPTPMEVPILDEEPDVGSGVSAALKLAMSKGYLDKEQKNRPSNTRLAHLQAKHYSIEDKSYGDDGDRSRRERYTGPIQDFREKDTFKPNVKLEYIDDDGRVLNSKEAFRYLSHKFHGKGPGKNKVEKRIKKNVQEGLMKKMSSTDTPLGTLNMLQSKQKELQSPYIVLSGSKHTHSTVISKARR